MHSTSAFEISDMAARALLNKFHARIGACSSGSLMASSAGCPEDGNSNWLVQNYTFEFDELIAQMGGKFIVHHGRLPESVAQRLHILYRASPIIYAHRSLGRLDLSAEQVKAILEGKIHNRDVSSCGDLLRVVLCHSGAVQRQILRAFAVSNFGASDLADGLRGPVAYEELALQGAESAGSLVFGLRPEFAQKYYLRPVSIDGIQPYSRSRNDSYPSLPVWLSIPDNCATAALADFLDIVAGRIERDVYALQRLGKPDFDVGLVQHAGHAIVASAVGYSRVSYQSGMIPITPP